MITRRKFIAGATAAVALGANDAVAALDCSNFNFQGIQRCTAGVQIGPIRTAQQACPQWCWAACIETIFALHGLHVDQTVIVQKIFGNWNCSPAVGPQIIHAVNGNWVSSSGRRFRARATPLVDLQFGVSNPAAAAAAAQELAQDRPLINGALGHATVLTAMTYMRDQYGNGQPLGFVVRDPWPGNLNRRALSPQEVNGTNFLASIQVF